MAVTIAAGTQRFPNSLVLSASATNYSETLTAAGTISVVVPVSIININGTATGVNETYTLGTASYEGMDKYIITGQGAATASDSLGNLTIELANPVGSTASTNNVVKLEYPGMFHAKWINDRWLPFAGLTVGAVGISTATI